MIRVSLLHSLKGVADTLRYFWRVCFSKRRYGDGVLGAIDRNSFQGRVLPESLHHRSRHAATRIIDPVFDGSPLMAHIVRAHNTTAIRRWKSPTYKPIQCWLLTAFPEGRIVSQALEEPPHGGDCAGG